ncbi:respiratory nitrite reductase specific menaquinol--cytochrome-c reductase (NrfH) precursor [Desulforamulus reducens MI-1]|uniref:Respiratory nitrite reductase specific menaquinol--cytochrome-c reductase (NrfH) n=1 Tax=Desulforamulus reducens (strain ATCC BAA-1160 / DSM 100696 / MI-1) TaxID=349161 RepID=A4J2D6_DESRM|nr:NapC/NirT family cytochrome c [Desulforamulus reducens]ABO49239.1 respiratory nitrite reductase specific menaquinol--cytochrome-c reductase (NrfH) precursor [Desulforamulus reducens MI-1]
MKRTLQLLLVLAVVGLGSILAIKIPFISKHLDGSKFCGSCHIMDPWVDTYLASEHREHATCGDCHLPHDFIPGAFYKAFTGTRDTFDIIFGRMPNRIEISSHGSNVVNDNCLRCHTKVMEVVGYPKNDRGQDCYDCHQNIPHSRYWYIQKESE